MTSIGELLRDWRGRRRISQLDLAIEAGISARHISFIETGRSRPSRDMVLRLADQLDVPVRDRNALLLAAGHAPTYTETSLDDLPVLYGALERLLIAYEPNPALILDGSYDVVAANSAVGPLLAGVAGHLLEPPMNAIRLTLHPDGLAPRIRNLPEWRGHLLRRVQQHLPGRPALRELYEEVAAYPGGEAEPGPGESIALPLRIAAGDQVLSFVTTVTTFNTPLDVTVSELAVETFLPADQRTSAFLTALGPGSR